MIKFRINVVPPTATAQQKGVFVAGGRARFYTKAKVRRAESLLAQLIAPHAPTAPVEGPVRLHVRWCWPYRKSERRGIVKAGADVPHTSRPDLDNLEKNLLDVMTRLQFWRDDAQVAEKCTSKAWGPAGYLDVRVEEIFE